MAIKGQPAKPAQRYFGKITPKVAGYSDWITHDHAQHWGDGGAADELGKEVAQKARTIIAEQTREAVADYARDAQLALTAVRGHLVVAVKLENDGASMIIQVPLAELINAGINEAFKAAFDPGAQDFISTLIQASGTFANLKKDLIRAQQEIANAQGQPQGEVA
jgi:hypothetical protein